MIELLGEDGYREWDTYVDRSPAGTLFHTTAWKKVVEKTFGYKPCYLVLKDTEGRIAGVLPFFLVKGIRGKALVSLPFMEYGGPIVSEGHWDEALNGIIAMFESFRKEQGVRYLEMKAPPGVRYPEAEESGFMRVFKAYDYDLKIGKNTSFPDYWQKIRAKTRVRHSVIQASRRGVRIEPVEELHSFYALHLKSMSRIGSLLWPATFFDHIREYCPQSRFAGAYAGTNMIGGMLSLPYRGRDLAVVLSYDRSFQEYRASDLLYCQEIKFAFDNGFGIVDFGRTRPGSAYEKYKQKWGTTRTALYSYVYPAAASGMIDPYALYLNFSRATRNNILWNFFLHTPIGQSAIRYFP